MSRWYLVRADDDGGGFGGIIAFFIIFIAIIYLATHGAKWASDKLNESEFFNKVSCTATLDEIDADLDDNPNDYEFVMYSLDDPEKVFTTRFNQNNQAKLNVIPASYNYGVAIDDLCFIRGTIEMKKGFPQQYAAPSAIGSYRSFFINFYDKDENEVRPNNVKAYIKDKDVYRNIPISELSGDFQCVGLYSSYDVSEFKIEADGYETIDFQLKEKEMTNFLNVTLIDKGSTNNFLHGFLGKKSTYSINEDRMADKLLTIMPEESSDNYKVQITRHGTEEDLHEAIHYQGSVYNVIIPVGVWDVTEYSGEGEVLRTSTIVISENYSWFIMIL